MSIELVLKKCVEQNVELSVEAGQLDVLFDEPPTEDLISLLRENKAKLITHISENHQVKKGKSQLEKLNRSSAPLSFTQKRLWFIEKLEEKSTQYNIPLTLELSGPVDHKSLKAALYGLANRHEVLRTVFGADEQRQYVLDKGCPEFSIVDLSDKNDSSSNRKSEELLAREMNRGFELSEELKIRGLLLKLDEQRHIFHITLHHIACDGWSLEILTREFIEFYQASRDSREVNLSELVLQYSDFAFWQEKNYEFFEEETEYWSNKLSGIPDLHSVHTDKPRPQELSFEGDVLSTKIDSALLQKAKHYSGENNFTLFMLLQTAFSVLISRWSMQNDVVMGTPIAGREEKELEELVGYFANSLVLRTEIDEKDTFESLLNKNSQMLMDAYSHQSVPFEMLVDYIKPERSLSYSPIFQIFITLHSQKKGEIRLPNLVIKDVTPKPQNAKFDIELSIEEQQNGLVLDWTFSTELFNKTTIETLSNNFTELLDKAIRSPNALLSTLDINSNDMGEAITKLERSGQSETQLSSLEVLSALKQQVEEKTDSIALVSGNNQLSYRELDERSTQLANYLLERNIGPNDVVGLQIERSVEMVVGLYGILKSGAAYLPLDLSLPEERVKLMIKDSGCRLTLSSKELETSTLGMFSTSEKALPTVDKSNLAYVIYTSGSTGTPKAVRISHKNLSTFLAAMNEHLEDNIESKSLRVWLAVTSISFDISVLELFGALSHGFKVVIAPDLKSSSAQVASEKSNQVQETKESLSILDLITKHSITHVQCTPSYAFLNLLEDQSQSKADDKPTTSSLKKIFLGGEALPNSLLSSLQHQFSAEILNMYGPTEATVWATSKRFKAEAQKVTIGTPLNGYRCYVLDRNKMRQPVGCVGELYIAGDAVSSGYLNNDSITQQKFVRDIVDLDSFMYATGDYARWNNSGELEFYGRGDEQVKLRGHRIELGEIESTISHQTSVRQAAVLLDEKDKGNARLVAYVLPEDLVSPENIEKVEIIEEPSSGFTENLKIELASLLPEYMLPSIIILVNKLPTNSNGKLDRKKLPEAKITLCDESLEELNSNESRLSEVWKLLLPIEGQLKKTDSFFDLGGHSLLLTQLVFEIRKTFSIEVSLREVFANPTLGALSALIENRDSSKEIVQIRRLNQSQSKLSFSQQRIWLLEQLQGSTAEYNIAAAYKVIGRFNTEVAEDALNRIVERHEVLRTIYSEVDGQAIQLVQENVNLKLNIHDLSALPKAKKSLSINQQIQQDSEWPFDLSNDLMIRVSYLKTKKGEEGQEGILLFNMHHIASDGWSFRVLASEFSNLYNAILNHQQVELPLLPIQYSDYSEWQRVKIESSELLKQQDFWKEQLKDIPVSHGIPLDFPRPAQKTHKGRMLKGWLSPADSERFRAIAEKHKVSLFVLLHAVLGLLISRHSNTSDIVIGTPVAGRAHSELENLIGFFANTLVLRTSTDHGKFEEYLAHVRDVNREASKNQDVPFEVLVEHSDVIRTRQHTPLFQIMLTMNIGDSMVIDIPDVELSQVEYQGATAKFDLEVIAQDTSKGIFIGWVYDESLFTETHVKRLQSNFEQLAFDLIKNEPEATKSLKLLSDKETEQLIVVNNSTEVDYAKDSSIEKLFESQVKNSPEQVATIFDGTELSYRQINQSANQLANYLFKEGVAQGSTIGICMDRSHEMVISILAVLKSGCAYLPIDPAIPSARISYMLENAGVRKILTSNAHAGLFNSLKEIDLVRLDNESLSRIIGQMPNGNLELRIAPNDLAYVIYTSGSTGQPKGVMTEHQALNNRIDWMQRTFKLTKEDRVLQKTPYSFDVSVWEFIWTLCNGATLVIAAPEGHRDPSYLTDIIELNKVTFLHFVPSMLSAFLSDSNSNLASSVRCVVCSGEALTQEHVAAFNVQAPHVELHNLYGPTESAIDVTHFDCSTMGVRSTVPIGKPIQNTQILVLDKEMNLCPQGTPGELHIGGDGLARGYVNNTELTNEKFVPNPFTSMRGKRLYKTGDLVKLADDGNIEYLGRIDHQIKLRGFRIELGEIESQIRRNSEVYETIVIHDSERDLLCAYLVCNKKMAPEGEAVFTQALSAQLSKTLPEYMIPSHFLTIAEIPLNANGKADVKKLPKVSSASPTLATYEEPSNDQEAQLCKIWQEDLKRDNIGVTEDYFLLGGNSISAIRLVNKMNLATGMGFSVKELFAHTSIRELLAAHDENNLENHEAQLIEGNKLLEQFKTDLLSANSFESILPDDAEDFYPLSPIQRGMVFLSQMRPEEPIYHDQFSFIVSWNKFDFKRFDAAVEIVCKRHSILRSSFDLDSYSQPIQIVHSNATPRIYFEDLSSLEDKEKQKYISAFANKDKRDKFIKPNELLWRLAIFKLDDSDYCMMLSFQHAILDGWSVKVLNTELVETYLMLQEEKEFHEKIVNQSTYRDYVAIQLSRSVSEQSLGFWKEYLTDFERTKLPFNFSGRPVSDSNGMEMLFADFNGAELIEIESAAQRYQCTLKELCVTAHLYLLSLLCFDDDIVTGIVTHDRPQLDSSENILGCFLNTIPLRVNARKNIRIKKLVSSVKAFFKSTKQHEIFLAEIASVVGNAEGAANPLFDTLFNFTDFSQHTDNVKVLESNDTHQVEVESSEMTNTLFDMEVHKTTEQSLKLQLKYSPKYFYDNEMQYALRIYKNILKVIADPTVERLDDKIANNSQPILDSDFNRTEREYSHAQLIHQLFEGQVKKTPENIALSQNGITISYRELNERANQVAHALVERGVSSGDHIGVVLERSFNMVTGLLGILKAGAVYVPMEPDYPIARKENIANSANISTILTDQKEEKFTSNTILIDEIYSENRPCDNINIEKSSEDLAYVIYTSGSTGNPKGVMIAHHAAVNLIEWVNRRFSVDEKDSILFITSMCFDLSVYDIFGALATGAKIVIAEQSQVQNAEELAGLIKSESITFWDSVPATMSHLVTYLEQNRESLDLDLLDKLRLVFMSGDWIPVQLPSKIKGLFKNAEVISLGGATEGTVWSNYYSVECEKMYRNSIPYGKPISNNRFYILDSEQKSQPYGVAGNLYIGGDGVAEGYLNDEFKTAAAFFIDPFVSEQWSVINKPARMYKTGDIGRMLPDGNMEFLGREDHQVKLRGFRIELGEIESLLCEHESISESVATILEGNNTGEPSGDSDANQVLVAYIVARSNANIDIEVLKSYLATRLPNYMIPAFIVCIDQIPVNANGKIDRKLLPKLDNLNSAHPSFVAASSTTEKVVSKIWNNLLKIEKISVNSNFFELGGHSLLATRLASELRAKFNIEVPIRVIFEQATIQELSTYLDSANELRNSLTALSSDVSTSNQEEQEKWTI